MGIDSSIALQTKQPAPPDQIGQAVQAYTLKSAMLSSQKVEQDMRDQSALKTVFADPQAFDVDPSSGVPVPKPATMQKLYEISPSAAQKMGEATMKMRADQQKQQELALKMRKEYVDQAGPTLATLASEYETLSKGGDKDAAWAALKPKVDAANQQFEGLAKRAGVPFKPISDADHLMQGAGQWSKYAENRMKAVQPQTPHEKQTETNQVEAAKREELRITQGDRRLDLTERRTSAAERRAAAAEDRANAAISDKAPKGDFSKTGKDFLETIDPADRKLVEKLANFEIDPKTLSTRGGEREKYLRMASQFDPNFDQKNYNTQSQAINKFATGQQGNTVRSLNVAIEHMDTARRLGAALNNKDIPLFNKVANELATQLGKPTPTSFNAVKEIVADEVVKGVIGGAGALQDREAAAKKIRDASSPAQLNAVFDSWTELLGGQLKGLERQYEGATSRKDFRNRFVTPRAKEAIEKVGGGGGGAGTVLRFDAQGNPIK